MEGYRFWKPKDWLKCSLKALRRSRNERAIYDLVCTLNWLPLFIVIFSFLTKLAIKLHINPYILPLKWSVCVPGCPVQQSQDFLRGMVILPVYLKQKMSFYEGIICWDSFQMRPQLIWFIICYHFQTYFVHNMQVDR